MSHLTVNLKKFERTFLLEITARNLPYRQYLILPTTRKMSSTKELVTFKLNTTWSFFASFQLEHATSPGEVSAAVKGMVFKRFTLG